MAVSGINDHLTLDRLRLEFGGLCNQILSADRIQFESVDDLIGVCRKAGGYINIGLEKLSGKNRNTAEEFIKNHPLTIIFRAGFSQALELKWHAKRWLESSWFAKRDLDADFWGNNYGGELKGVLLEKPLYYSEQKEKEPFRDFRSLDEVTETERSLNRMALLDMLLESIVNKKNDPETVIAEHKDVTIFSLLITVWIKKIIGLDEDFKPISLENSRKVFKQLRKGENSAPYKMSSHKKLFIGFFNSFSAHKDLYSPSFIEETLSELWNDFVEEYSMVELSDLDPKYSKYVLIVK